MSHLSKMKYIAIGMCMVLVSSLLVSCSVDGGASKTNKGNKETKITGKSVKSQHLKKLKKLDYNSRCIHVYDLTSNTVIFDRNGGKRMPVTSLVKLMNCRKALQIMSQKNIKLSDKIKLDAKVLKLTLKQGETSSDYVQGEKLRYKDLLYAMMLRSDADSAKTIAIRLKGNAQNYVKEMNLEAKKLGLKDTEYVNVDGAKKKGQYSTARDVIRLLRIAMKDKKFYKIITTASYRSGRTPQHPQGVKCSNTTVKRFKEYNNSKFKVIGGKYGYSRSVGRTVVVVAKKHKKIYLIVVMGNKHRKDKDKCTNESIGDVLKIMRNI